MKVPFCAAVVCLAAGLICGCASKPKQETHFNPGDADPPDFLVSPVATVLTNANGFSAHLVATVSGSGSVETKTGDMLGRDGRLIFQPALPVKDKKARARGGFFFIWDETQHSGYVLSDALQGYAPIKPALRTPKVSIESRTSDPVVVDINGHPCHKCEVVVSLHGDLKVSLTVWEADDLSKFPMRVQCSNGQDLMTLNFSQVRLAPPAKDLFSPPDGFLAYATTDSLMNELIVREATLARRNQAILNDTSHPANWVPSPSYH